jgi:hypothetical protein
MPEFIWHTDEVVDAHTFKRPDGSRPVGIGAIEIPLAVAEGLVVYHANQHFGRVARLAARTKLCVTFGKVYVLSHVERTQMRLGEPSVQHWQIGLSKRTNGYVLQCFGCGAHFNPVFAMPVVMCFCRNTNTNVTGSNVSTVMANK